MCCCQQKNENTDYSSDFYIKTIAIPIENSVIQRYLKDADSLYSDSIGRYGRSILDCTEIGREKSPYLSHVVWHEDRSPDWTQQPSSFFLPCHTGKYVLVSTTPDFKSSLRYQVVDSIAEIFNLVPQTIYWYKIIDTSGNVLYRSVFKTFGRVRMIKTNWTQNVRDIGGWACDSGYIAYEKIIRGGLPEIEMTAPEHPLDILGGIVGISYELDLRKESELTKCPFGKRIEYKNTPITQYVQLLENDKGQAYKEIASCLQIISENLQLGKRTFVHCQMGADRTGTLIAIIEAICGVSEADIVKDWELTSFNSRNYLKRINLFCSSFENYVQSDTTELRAVFNYLYNNYGGSEGCTLKEQVCNWLINSVFFDCPNQAVSIINTIRRFLIEPQQEETIVIKEYCDARSFSKYIVAKNDAAVKEFYTIIDTIDNSLHYSTDYIECSENGKLWTNIAQEDFAQFYDKDYCLISSCSVGGKDHQEIFTIPKGTAYVRFSYPQGKDWSAVLY